MNQRFWSLPESTTGPGQCLGGIDWIFNENMGSRAEGTLISEKRIARADFAAVGFRPAHRLEDGDHDQQHGGSDGAVLVQQLQGTCPQLLLLAARPNLQWRHPLNIINLILINLLNKCKRPTRDRGKSGGQGSTQA